MKIKSLLFFSLATIVAAGIVYTVVQMKNGEDDEVLAAYKQRKVEKARYSILRAQYDFDMVKDPATGRIPYGIHDRAVEQALRIAEASRPDALSNWFPAGPNNQGGRTRAIAYDKRYNGTSNRVIIAGGVSGGIFRSTDGGANWTRVTPENEIHNLTALVQDPRSGSENIWYAGGGEAVGNSANELGAVYFGQGILKSIDNGATWNRLSLTNITDVPGNAPPGTALEAFDNPFDFVHKLVINPANGDLYISGHRRLLKSTDGGNSFYTVFGSTVGATSSTGQNDIVIAGNKIVLAVNGGNPDASLRGVWTSTTGELNSWTRIAGGSTLGVDSVADWRGNSYTFINTTPPTAISKRIIMATAPSNQNLVYILYENGLSNSANGVPEADLFRLDMTAGNNWANRSANLPDFPGSHPATDPFAIQGGYDMSITVKPDNPNFILLGGTSFYRSTDGFASTANTSWIGGYGNTLPTLTFYPNSHPDIHNAVFHPTNFNEVICANDGGLQVTNDITAPGSTVSWTHLNNYQTLQYYYIALDPEANRNNFLGGAQDNGTQYRDKTGGIGIAAADSNNHRRILSGDGFSVGFSKPINGEQFVYASVQFGSIRRAPLVFGLSQGNFTVITPVGLTGSGNEFGEFVTNFKLNPDNTEDLYYVNWNRLFRTTSASTVTPTTWTELTGVGTTVDPNGQTGGFNAIRAIAFSRGPYATSHAMYIGTTNAKIYRIDNPRNAAAGTIPVNITPPAIGAGSNVQDIAVNPNNDDEILAVVSNYGVVSLWWTNNAKSATPTWKSAEGNLTLPSFRSAAIVVKKDAANNPVTEYYVGTSVGLYSAVNIANDLINNNPVTWTREGGNVINLSLIQSISYRPVDNVLLLGTHGNGAYYGFMGTANFVPNQNTGTNDPIVNDRNFIDNVFPTITGGPVNVKVGNMTGVRKISIQVFSMSGQEVYRAEQNYQNAQLNLERLPAGAYTISIYSDNRKYRHLQKFVKR